MGCCEAIKSVMGKNYANFSGRARRSEYWFYSLFQYILNVILFILDVSTSTRTYSSYDRYSSSYSSTQLTVFGVINIIIYFFPIKFNIYFINISKSCHKS